MRDIRLLCLLAALAAGPAPAATPASGTLSPATPTLTYSSTLPLANATAQTTPAAPTCTSPVLPCDDFALTLDLPAAYAAANPRALLFVSALWPVNNFLAYNLYILDSSGTIIDYQATERDPVVVSIPAVAGQYTLRLVPQYPSPLPITTTVSLIGNPGGPAATGIAPRFRQLQSPAGLGDQVGGEMNIGFNPASGRVMTLSYTQTLRTTFPEDLTPALPEACDALWEDVSEPLTTQNTNDPILFTDQVTGRTFVSQLQAGTAGDSIFAFTDDDGENWALSTTGTNNGGIDHQTVGGGPYAAGGTAGPTGDYPHAVYYCSQSVALAFCTRSDDGGDTFLAPAVLKTSADCDGFTPNIHGHVKVAPDGTAYVPDRNCGGVQAVIVSEDSGDTWEVRRIPGTTSGDNDASLGIASDGTLYYCYVSGDAHPHVTVSTDRGLTWSKDRDIGAALGIEHAVFVNAVAGDPDRAACAFLGTRTPGNYQSVDFDGLWYVYAAMTYDGGESWHSVDPVPEDPVQGVGGISLGGTTAVQNRNLLDFNEITMDERGRVLYGYNDGCLGDCISTGVPNQVAIPGLVINSAAKSTILQQMGGRGLLAEFDTAEPAAPRGACLAGARDNTRSRLNWKVPDNGGNSITSYRIYRGLSADALAPIAFSSTVQPFDDLTADPAVEKFFYKITGVNSQGEGVFSNTVELTVGPALPEIPGTPPPVTPPVTPTPVAAAPSDSGRFGSGAMGWWVLGLCLGIRRRSELGGGLMPPWRYVLKRVDRATLI